MNPEKFNIGQVYHFRGVIPKYVQKLYAAIFLMVVMIFSTSYQHRSTLNNVQFMKETIDGQFDFEVYLVCKLFKGSVTCYKIDGIFQGV